MRFILLSNASNHSLFSKRFILFIILSVNFINIEISNKSILLSSAIIDDHWAIKSPYTVGMNETKLIQLDSYIDENLGLLDSMIIIKNGFVIKENYYNNQHENYLHSVYSITKSIMSVLLGIAIFNGFIGDLNQKVINFFPNYNINNLDDMKRNISIENLLTMTSGFDWNESGLSYQDPNNSFSDMLNNLKPIQYMLD